MFGKFAMQKGLSSMFTPGIVPEGMTSGGSRRGALFGAGKMAGNTSQGVQKKQKRRSMGNNAVRLAGAALMDLDGTMGSGRLDYALDGLEQRKGQEAAQRAQMEEEARRREAMAALGLTPEQQALAAIDPEGVTKALTAQKILKPSDMLARERFGHDVQTDGRDYDYKVGRDGVLDSRDERDYLFRVQESQRDQGNVDRTYEAGRSDEMFDRAKPQSNGITIGADGSVQIGGPAYGATTRQMAGLDAQAMSEARTRANDLQPVLQTLYSARAELMGPDGQIGTADDLDTGSFAPAVQAFRRFIPGEQDGEVRYDNFDALSKEFGIEKLSGIGGNDTERELITAIQTGPNTGAQEGSNIQRINRQIATFEFIGETRRNFQSRWIADHGSLSRLAQTGPYKGMTFDEALSSYQRKQARERGLLGQTRTTGDATPQIATQRGDIGFDDPSDLLDYMSPEERALFEGQ